jgi:phosphocarrier protein
MRQWLFPATPTSFQAAGLLPLGYISPRRRLKISLGGLPSAFLPCRTENPKNMAQRDFTIQNKLGIHARPAAQFVKMANRFQSDITVEKDGEEVDGKSIMGLMMLAAGHGSVILVSAEGEDEEAALDAIADLIARKFEED